MDRLDMVQCECCHFWRWPEELDGDGECDTCVSFRESRSLVVELKAAGELGLATELDGSVWAVMVALNNQRAAKISQGIFTIGLDKKEVAAV
jgi:hypothetical protein